MELKSSCVVELVCLKAKEEKEEEEWGGGENAILVLPVPHVDDSLLV